MMNIAMPLKKSRRGSLWRLAVFIGVGGILCLFTVSLKLKTISRKMQLRNPPKLHLQLSHAESQVFTLHKVSGFHHTGRLSHAGFAIGV